LSSNLSGRSLPLDEKESLVSLRLFLVPGSWFLVYRSQAPDPSAPVESLRKIRYKTTLQALLFAPFALFVVNPPLSALPRSPRSDDAPASSTQTTVPPYTPVESLRKIRYKTTLQALLFAPFAPFAVKFLPSFPLPVAMTPLLHRKAPLAPVESLRKIRYQNHPASSSLCALCAFCG
jgi:hypothetical protein